MNSILRTASGAMKALTSVAEGTANDAANINSIAHHKSYAKLKASFPNNMKTASYGGAGSSIASSNSGSGVELEGFSTSFAQGAIRETGVPEHLAIDGEKVFFRLKDQAGNRQFVTRAGDFRFDGDYLVNTRGYRVQGLSGGSVVFTARGTDKNNLTWTIETAPAEPAGNPGDISKAFEPSTNTATIDNQTGGHVSDADVNEKRPLVTNATISADGQVQLNFDTGHSVTVAQILLMKFENPSKLDNAGQALYENFEKAGALDFNGIWGANPRSPGMGILRPGSLELSNVDITDTFTELVTSERYFQVNAKVFHSADNLMQETVNLIR